MDRRTGRHRANINQRSHLLLACNLVATAYLVLGSKPEEIRLKAAHGRAYEAYQGSGIPFFVPGAASGHLAG